MRRCDVSVRYGDDSVALTVDDDRLLWSIGPKDVDPVANESAAVADALNNPTGCTAIPDLARAKKAHNAVLLVDDLTRTTPHKIILPLVLDQLNSAGIDDKHITAIVAVGTHRKLTDQEIVDRFGAENVARIRFVNHDFDDASNLVNLGKTSTGTPIVVNKTYLQSDLKIAVGSIVPHMYAGWSGGSKMIQPGVSGGETTAETHLKGSRFGLDMVLGRVENPVRQDMDEVGIRSGLDFIVNVVQDRWGKLVGVGAGDPIRAHRCGAEIARGVYEVTVPGLADVVIAGCYPTERDIWQSQKPLVTACMLCKPGGRVVLVGRYRDTVGDKHPLFWNSASKTLDEIEEAANGESLRDRIDAAALLGLRPHLSSRTISVICEERPRHEFEGMGFEWLGSDPKAALDRILRQCGDGKSIGVIQSHTGDLVPNIVGSN